MKASEVLRKYRGGHRDFQGVNLRGQSFRGLDLSGADFSKADIRSANFTDATLIGAKFIGAKCGLQKRWVTFLVILSWLLAGLSGYSSLLTAAIVFFIFDASGLTLQYQIAVWIDLIIVVVFLLLVILQWIRAGAGAGAYAFAFAGAVAIAIAGAIAVAVAVTFVFAFAGAVSYAFAFAGAVAFGGAVAVAIAGVFAVAVAVTVAGAIAVAIAVPVAVAVAVAVAGAFGFVFAETVAKAEAGAIAGVLAIAVAVAGVSIGWRAMKGEERYAWLRSFAIAFIATGGTSFRGADLTNADFTGAQLKSADFRKAILIRTCWRSAQKLDQVRPGDTYLQKAKVRQWLKGKGQNKNFDHQILRGVNFQGANLQDASFIGADLSEANLQDADLSRAKLVQTQLDQTDLTGSTLTGAFIEDWGITSSTVMNGVRCKYVFMRLPPEKRPKWLPLPVEESLDPNPRRKPDNWSEVFENGDFADFIKPIFDTLDLYHNQGVDPRAIAISWKELAENNPDAELRFASMEVKGEDNLLLRLKTAPNADLSRLNAEYFDIYNQLKALKAESKKLLAEKDNRIQRLETMVLTALESPKFKIEGDAKMEGDYYEQSGKFGIGHISGGEIKGNAKVAAEIYEAEKQNLAEAAAEIQKLLQQLEKSDPTATEADKIAHINDETTPKFKRRVVAALKAAGDTAIDEFLDNSYVKVGKAAIMGWMES